MRQRNLTERAEQGIARYRASDWHRDHHGSCRLTPTCSHYAEAALRRHRLPVAVLLVALRVLRCTPLTARPSGRAVRKAVGVLTLASLTTLTIAWTASAASAAPRASDAFDTAGGCRATVGGRPIGQLDADHPLQVSKGQAVVLSGSAPTGSRGGAGVVSARIHFIKDLAKTSTFEPTTGTTFSQAVNVDTYLKYGSGVYRVDGRSHGPTWSCDASFYLELHGSKLAAEVAVAVGALGAIGTIAATGGKEPEASDREKADASGMAVMEQMSEIEHDRWESERKDREDNAKAMNATVDKTANAAVTTGAGCLVALLAILILLAQDSSPFAAIPPTGRTSDRVWVKGHTVWGFISGLFCGLGLLVAGWQFNLYPLTRTNIVLPLAVAVIGALRARRGRAWKVA